MATENYSGIDFGNKARGFEQPTQLPRNADERAAWQVSNKAWWETTPMRYDWREGLGEEPGTEKYFREIDRRFLDSVCKYMPWRKYPFDPLIDYARLRDKDVLE